MKKKYGVTSWILVFIALAGLTSCTQKPRQDQAAGAQTMSSVNVRPFGAMKNGRSVQLYTLKNRNGLELSAMNYGGIVTSLKTPDRKGVLEDIVLGFDSLSSYEKESPYFGAIVGRYANRIANGKFFLDGKEYTLAVNNNANHLHGGNIGFDKVFWKIDIISKDTDPSIRLTYVSKDGEEGYPGELTMEVTYTLTENNEWKIDYKAQTDKRTILNITQHTYFNLTGDSKRDILGHELMLNADKFIPVDQGLIPTGELEDVANTAFDFRKPTPIGARIRESDPQLKAGRGYDHGWVLNRNPNEVESSGSLFEPVSGRRMEFSTTEPAVQFYSGNFLDGKLTGKNGVIYKQRFGLCLETEHFPDSPNQKKFPSVILEPGKVYESETVYAFSAR